MLTYVETGNADAGLVYETDAQSDAKVRIVAMPPRRQEPIVYPVAVVGAGARVGPRKCLWNI